MSKILELIVIALAFALGVAIAMVMILLPVITVWAAYNFIAAPFFHLPHAPFLVVWAIAICISFIVRLLK